jgi:hypothetical protein
MPNTLIQRLLAAIVLISSLAVPVAQGPYTAAQVSSRYFPETKRTVQGRFLHYWESNGGLAQYGYPISDEIQEESETDGRSYLVQYFERAVVELHPDNRPPYDVLLSLLGRQRYLEYYGPGGAPNQRASTDKARFFPETQRTLGGVFRSYWEAHGGLMQQGYPISDEFQEVSALDGKPYTVQYFERAVFEHHPENPGTPYEVLLTQLGIFQLRAKQGTLAIPGPSAPDLVQAYPAGSESHLVWCDVRITVPEYHHGPTIYTVVAIFALDLSTNRLLTVTNNSNTIFQPPRISGSTVLWQERDSGCSNCSKLLAKDLRSGASVTIAAGPGTWQFPSISGRTVVWVDSSGSDQQVIAKDLDTGATTIYASSPGTHARLLSYPVISDQYVAWVETDPVVPTVFKLRAANRKTRQVQTVAFDTGGGYVSANFDIFGNFLVWSDPSMKMIDLNTGKVTFLTEEGSTIAPDMRGNTFVWKAYSPDARSYQDYSLWGSRLSDPKPIHLDKIEAGFGGPTVAGEWIVWAGKKQLSSTSRGPIFTRAKSALPLPTPTPSLSGSRVVTAGTSIAPVGAGNALFWIGKGSHNRIYRYDADTRAVSVIADGPEYKLAVATDGQDVVWLELLSTGLYRIQHYDLRAKQVSTVVKTQWHGENYGVLRLVTDRQNPPALALDQGVLYYRKVSPEGSGLWARTLATGEEWLISAEGYGPVAANGRLMWTEQRRADTQTGTEWSLHLHSRYDPNVDIVLTRYMYALDYTEYSVSEDHAVWHSGGRGVFIFHIPSRTAGEITPQYSFPKSRINAPLVSFNRVVWTESVDSAGLHWLVRVHRLDNGSVSTLISTSDQSGTRVAAWAILGGRAVAYLTTGSSSPRGYVLEVVELP